MLENYVHRLMNVYRHVDLFISPSIFLRNKFIECGIGNKVITVNNFINVDEVQPYYSNSGYVVYVGRLNYLKGVDTLIEAAKRVPKLMFKIVGNGELLDVYKDANISNVEFLGYKSGDELHNLIAKSLFAVVPSQWYENFPYSVLESFAFGKAVIGSRVGGIPELIKENETGLLFEMGNVNELREKIEYLCNNEHKILSMGKNARRMVEEKFSAEEHYKKLMGIYKNVLGRV